MNFASAPVPSLPMALLVDGENVSKSLAPRLLDIAADHGSPQVRRVYGAAEHIAAWSDYGFRLCATRPGKNAADLLLCVEAMDLALREGFATILIASSDRDFTYLAERLREAGKTVIGIGETKTPPAFRAACSRFVQLGATSPAPAPARAFLPATKLIPLVRDVLTEATSEGRWCTANWIGSRLKKAHPGFDHRDYGEYALETKLQRLKYFAEHQADNGTRLFRDPHPLNPAATPHSAP